MEIPETIVVKPQAVIIRKLRGTEEAKKKAETEQEAVIQATVVPQVEMR